MQRGAKGEAIGHRKTAQVPKGGFNTNQKKGGVWNEASKKPGRKNVGEKKTFHNPRNHKNICQRQFPWRVRKGGKGPKEARTVFLPRKILGLGSTDEGPGKNTPRLGEKKGARGR